MTPLGEVAGHSEGVVAVSANSLAGVRARLRHVINCLSGSNGEGFSDAAIFRDLEGVFTKLQSTLVARRMAPPASGFSPPRVKGR